MDKIVYDDDATKMEDAQQIAANTDTGESSGSTATTTDETEKDDIEAKTHGVEEAKEAEEIEAPNTKTNVSQNEEERMENDEEKCIPETEKKGVVNDDDATKMKDAQQQIAANTDAAKTTDETGKDDIEAKNNGVKETKVSQDVDSSASNISAEDSTIEPGAELNQQADDEVSEIDDQDPRLPAPEQIGLFPMLAENGFTYHDLVSIIEQKTFENRCYQDELFHLRHQLALQGLSLERYRINQMELVKQIEEFKSANKNLPQPLMPERATHSVGLQTELDDATLLNNTNMHKSKSPVLNRRQATQTNTASTSSDQSSILFIDLTGEDDESFEPEAKQRKCDT